MFTFQVNGTLLQHFVNLFYQLGIWGSDEESNFRKIGKKLTHTFYGALFPIFFATNALLCTDRNESIFSAQAAIIVMVLYVKFSYLLFKKPEILAFLHDTIVVHSIENLDEYEHTNKKIKKFMGFVRPYCFAFFLTAPLIIVLKLPIFSDDKVLPVFISLSWNDSEVIYWLAYTFVSLSTSLYVVVNLLTTLIWYIMLNYSIEYELVGNKLSRLGHKNARTRGKMVKIQESFELPQRSMFVEELIVLIKAYRNLIITIERFTSCFTTLFLCQIVTSGIVICASVYNIAFSSNDNILQTELYVAILVYVFFDIFLVMYLANGITVASDRLAYCFFESNWIEQTQSCKKYVLIMGEAFKRPQRLVILIYPLNLETFMTVSEGLALS
ncbi:putative odorant receptor 71a [Bradysia coprophila]|uniref:putative odorant receptor 71a n=1 Tax=Bradysia coprophila TaxID=38358 RepID=UPI00187D90C4|nr:putative odorant receptor 71a [Bradysia coprophila]